MKRAILILGLLLGSICLYSQQQETFDDHTIHPAVVLEGDTIANVLIKEIVVFPQRVFTSKRDYRNYRRMIHNVKKVYPYAQIARYKISEMDVTYASIEDEKERQAYIKKVEKELRAEFEDQLVNLTISQGRLLIKLIDREVGRSSYAVIRDLKGNVSAVFWQAIARIFGSSLKTEFDAYGEDKILNEIITLYEYGLI